jgi:hypothetical protein
MLIAREGVTYGVKPYDGRPEVIDSSTDSYVSSDESERAMTAHAIGVANLALSKLDHEPL